MPPPSFKCKLIADWSKFESSILIGSFEQLHERWKFKWPASALAACSLPLSRSQLFWAASSCGRILAHTCSQQGRGRCWGLVSWTLFEKTVGTKGISKPNFPSIIRCFSSYLSRNLWEVELWEMFLKFQRKTGNSGWLVFFSLTEKNLLTKTEAEIMRHFCV